MVTQARGVHKGAKYKFESCPDYKIGSRTESGDE
jgi:hypothetical protein